MALSKLELAVDTGKWDGGLKKAQQALNSFTDAHGGLQQALDKESQKMSQFVRMMGSMESKAKTAKGQMNDYKSSIEQLSTAYNRMSDAQKSSQIGQDYLHAIDQMKQKFQEAKQQADALNRSLGDIGNTKLPDLGSSGGSLFSGLGDKLSGAIQVFGGNMMTKAADAAIGALGNLASEMQDMVRQGIEMAKAGEGIRIAFERLGRGDILDGLREATHGTVTDLELMKAAVKFNDFKLPVEELGTMLAFAQQKAKDTGQSVDYMVDSIVTGLGRKSLMILDNLGLSANEIKEKMAETGDMTKAVGEIIRKQMAQAGDYVETAADRAAQANVSLQNKMEELGRKFAPVEEASNQLWTSMKIGILDVVGGPLARLLDGLTEAGRLKNALNDMNGDGSNGRPTKVQSQLKKVQVAKNAGGSDYIINSMVSGQIEKYNRQIMDIDAKIKNGGKWESPNKKGFYHYEDVGILERRMNALIAMRDEYASGAKEIMKPVKADIDTKGAQQSVESLKVKLIELEAQRKKAIEGGDTGKANDLMKQINQTKKDIKGLGGTVTTKHNIDTDAPTGSVAALTKEIQTLQKEQQKATSPNQWQQYEARIEQSKDKIALMKGELPKDKQAVFTMKVNDEQLKQLEKDLPKDAHITQTVTVKADTREATAAIAAVPSASPDEKTVTVKADTREATAAIAAVPSASPDEKTVTVIADTYEATAAIAAVPSASPDEKTVTVIADTYEALQKLQEIAAMAQDKEITLRYRIETIGDAPAPQAAPIAPVQKLTDTLGRQQPQQAKQPEGQLYGRGAAVEAAKLRQQVQLEVDTSNAKVDTETLHSLMQTAVQNGIDDMDLQFGIIGEQIGKGINIPDEAFEQMQEQVNERLAKIGEKPIKIDFKTGGIEKLAKDTDKAVEEMNSAANAINNVGTALQSIEDPTAKVMGIVAQAVATIALTFAKSLDKTFFAWDWIAAAAAGTATMISTIEAIHQATGYAAGGIVDGSGGGFVPGRTFSGDQVGNVRLDAGELVLNRAMQGNIASQLQDGQTADSQQSQPYVTGEMLYLGLSNHLRRIGRGEIVTSR